MIQENKFKMTKESLQELKDLIPPHMTSTVQSWIEEGLEGGGFLSAVVEGELFLAVRRADRTNLLRLPQYVRFFDNFAPADCAGYKGATEKWRKILGHGS